MKNNPIKLLPIAARLYFARAFERKPALLLLALLLSMTGISQADTPVCMLQQITNSTSGAGNYCCGYVFTPKNNMVVTQLGYYGTDNNDFVDSHAVGIYDVSSGDLLVSATVSATTCPKTSAPLTGGFRYVPVTGGPTLLSTGTYALVALTQNDDPFIYMTTTGTAPTFTGINFKYNVTSPTAVTSLQIETTPNSNPAINYGFFGPSFQYQDGYSLLNNTSLPTSWPGGTPTAGKRIKEQAPGYANNSAIYGGSGTGLYHTTYLPTDWISPSLTTRRYPVIVEFPCNQYFIMPGTPESTKLGYYQSGGAGYIWVSMPFVDTTLTPWAHAPTWWGNSPSYYGNGAVVTQPANENATVEYARQALQYVIKTYGGDPSAVFLTGFSRGAVATGYIGLYNSMFADIWLAFMPHSHHDGATYTLDPTSGTASSSEPPYPRTSQIYGRYSYITCGDSTGDGGAADSAIGWDIVSGLGFNTQGGDVPLTEHTDGWITADSPTREALQSWLATATSSHSATFSISGHVYNSSGAGVSGAVVQTGYTHSATTNSSGAYTLAGLTGNSAGIAHLITVNGFSPPYATQNITLTSNTTGIDFHPETSPTSHTLVATANAYVASGTYESTVFTSLSGPANSLISKRVTNDSTSNYNRYLYLLFDWTSLGLTKAPASAKFTLMANSNSTPSTATQNIKVFGIGNITWTESGISWSNAPGLDLLHFCSVTTTSPALATSTYILTQPFSLQANTTVTFDITAYVQANWSQKKVTLQLINDSTPDSSYLVVNSRTASSNQPQLTIIP